MGKRIIYHPPAAHVIDEYAKKVCKQLAEKYGERFNTPEIVLGFAGYIRIAAETWTTHLNKANEKTGEKLDTNQE